MDNAFLSPRYLKIANEIMEWANSYLTASNPNIGRPGNNQEVCPFVRDSLENDSFYLAFHPEVDGQRDEPIQRIMYEYINIFKETPPFDLSNEGKRPCSSSFPRFRQNALTYSILCTRR